jgi:hypothetical protein
MTGPDANLTKKYPGGLACCVFKTIVNGYYVRRILPLNSHLNTGWFGRRKYLKA